MSALTNEFTSLNQLQLETEEKNGLTYVPWAVAWEALKTQDPDASFEVHEFGVYDPEYGTHMGETYVNQDGMVKVSVTAFRRTHTMHLPVMDYRNKSIDDPSSTQINNAIMRCFTKAMAMHGVGLYPYKGEDVPSEEAQFTPTQIRELRKLSQKKMQEDGVTAKDIKKATSEATGYEATKKAIKAL